MEPAHGTAGMPGADFQLGEWLVQPGLGRVSGVRGTVHLRPLLADLLMLLARHRGQVVSKDEIARTVWGRRYLFSPWRMASHPNPRKRTRWSPVLKLWPHRATSRQSVSPGPAWGWAIPRQRSTIWNRLMPGMTHRFCGFAFPRCTTASARIPVFVGFSRACPCRREASTPQIARFSAGCVDRRYSNNRSLGTRPIRFRKLAFAHRARRGRRQGIRPAQRDTDVSRQVLVGSAPVCEG